MSHPFPDAPPDGSAAPAAKPPSGRTAGLGFILVASFLDVMSFGMIIPVLPLLILQFKGGDAAGAAAIGALFGFAWAFMQFFGSPFLGALSDRFGRRPVLLVSIAGLGLDKLFMALAPSLAWLFVGRVISGVTAANFSTAAAYIADVSPPEKRARNFGLMNASFGAGFILGPWIGGELANPALGAMIGLDAEHATRLPFWVAGALCLVNALYGWFVLPESLPPERRSRFQLAKANPLGSLALIRAYPAIWVLVGVHFLYQLAQVVYPSVFVFYANYRYGWSAEDVGRVLALVGIGQIVVSGFLVQRIVTRLGEPATLKLALACGVACMGIYAWAPAGALFLIGIPFGSLMGLYGPSAQALMTQRVTAREQGQLQGALGAIMGLTAVIGTPLYPGLFSLAISTPQPFPGAPFWLACGTVSLALALVMWTDLKARRTGDM